MLEILFEPLVKPASGKSQTIKVVRSVCHQIAVSIWDETGLHVLRKQ